MADRDRVRLDRWLWSVRVFKTRASANDACRRGRVQVNDATAKPAQRVQAGDRVTTRRGDRIYDYEVVEPIEKRVSAAVAATCIVDFSPPPEVRPKRDIPAGSERERGSGRPTKKERRQLDRFRRM